MRLLAYRRVPLSVPCVFWKFEVRERLGPKTGGGGTAFPCILWHFNHWHTVSHDVTVVRVRLGTGVNGSQRASR